MQRSRRPRARIVRTLLVLTVLAQTTSGCVLAPVIIERAAGHPTPSSRPSATPTPTPTPSPSAGRSQPPAPAEVAHYRGGVPRVTGWPLTPGCRRQERRRPTKDTVPFAGEDAPVMAAYGVRPVGLAPRTGTTAHSCDRQLWSLVQAVMPTEAIERITEFVVVGFPAKSGSTLAESGAYPGENRSRWTLVVNPYLRGDWDGLPLGLAFAAAEVLTDNDLQVAEWADNCPDAVPPPDETGCLRPGSLIGAYADATWRADGTLRDWRRAVGSHRWLEGKALTRFYTAHKDAFVWESAATSPAADLSIMIGLWASDTLPRTKVAAKFDFIDGRADLRVVRERFRAVFRNLRPGPAPSPREA